MRNGALLFPERHAKVSHTHLGNAQRRKDLYPRGITEYGEEIRYVGDDLIFRKVIFDHVLIVIAEKKG